MDNIVKNNVDTSFWFEKVSKEEYDKTIKKFFQFDFVTYDQIELPKRSTIGSAGYDFKMTFDAVLNPKESLLIPTFISAHFSYCNVLYIFPRSSLGFKYNIQLANTVGIIDSDYYYSDNSGHIMIKLVNNGDEPVVLENGDKICQGILSPFAVTVNDDCKELRNGGIGSTGK